jgi:hypothetical protein
LTLTCEQPEPQNTISGKVEYLIKKRLKICHQLLLGITGDVQTYLLSVGKKHNLDWKRDKQ